MKRIGNIGLFALLMAICAPAVEAGAQMSTIPISRLQVQVHTCNSTNAGSADRVRVTFGGHPYWFNMGWAGARNSWKTYDVLLPYVATSSRTFATVGDLGSTMTIAKVGDDAWCIDDVRVFLNGWQVGHPAYGEVDANARIYSSPVVARTMDSDGAHPLEYTFALTSDLLYFVDRPYLRTLRTQISLWGIQQMLIAGFNHATSPSGNLYGRTYTPGALSLPTGVTPDYYMNNIVFSSGVKPLNSAGAVMPVASLYLLSSAQSAGGPLDVIQIGAVTSSPEFSSAANIITSCIETNVRRAFSGPTTQNMSFVIRGGATVPLDAYLTVVP